MSNAPQKNSTPPSASSPPSDDNVQKVAEIKEYLETKISELEGELARLRDMLVLVDNTLREKSFVPAIVLRDSNSEPAVSTASKTTNQSSSAVVESKVAQPPSIKSAETVPNPNERQLRRSKDAKILANALIEPGKVVIVPSQGVNLSQNTPPFESFFINRILRGFQSKDEDESRAGKLKREEILRYTVLESQGTISSVTISNYRDMNRLNEILNTITWAFTRMLEKK